MSDYLIVLTDSHRIHRMPIDDIKSQRRGGLGKTCASMKCPESPDGFDRVIDVVQAPEEADLLLFSVVGRCHKVKVADIPLGNGSTAGTKLADVLLEEEHQSSKSLSYIVRITMMVPIHDGLKREDGFTPYITLATKLGLVKRLALGECIVVNRLYGSSIIQLEQRGGMEMDEVISASFCGEDDDLWMASNNGHVARVAVSHVPILGRRAKGVHGMELKLSDGERLTSMITTLHKDEATLTTLYEHGFGSKVDTEAFSVHDRDTKGVQAAPVGAEIAALVQSEPGQDLVVITSTGRLIRIGEADVPLHKSRDAVGVTVIEVETDGQQVVVKAVAVGEPSMSLSKEWDITTSRASDPVVGTTMPANTDTIEEAAVPPSDTSHTKTKTTTTGSESTADYTYTAPKPPKQRGLMGDLRRIFRNLFG